MQVTRLIMPWLHKIPRMKCRRKSSWPGPWQKFHGYDTQSIGNESRYSQEANWKSFAQQGKGAYEMGGNVACPTLLSKESCSKGQNVQEARGLETGLSPLSHNLPITLKQINQSQEHFGSPSEVSMMLWSRNTRWRSRGHTQSMWFFRRVTWDFCLCAGKGLWLLQLGKNFGRDVQALLRFTSTKAWPLLSTWVDCQSLLQMP